MADVEPAISVRRVVHRYGQRVALAGVDLEVARGEIFGLLGPNGGGKTTLFRLISTLIPLAEGEICVAGCDIRRQPTAARRAMGVVFQAASLDKKLTVAENLRHQGHLYGLAGAALRQRTEEVLTQLRVADRAGDLVETLSGGLRRRVELAKGLLHRPAVLVLDEPSTGLDPGVRGELWSYLRQLRDSEGVTILLTTHLLEEAEKADRIAILHAGQIVALDTPDRLRATVGGDTLTLACDDAPRLAERVRADFQHDTQVVDGAVRLEHPAAHQLVAQLVEAYPGQIRSVTLGKPTLEDVFIARTGQRFATAELAYEEVAHG